jgi:hypothetical protein
MCGRHVLVDVLWRSTRLLGNAQLFNAQFCPQILQANAVPLRERHQIFRIEDRDI